MFLSVDYFPLLFVIMWQLFVMSLDWNVKWNLLTCSISFLSNVCLCVSIWVCDASACYCVCFISRKLALKLINHYAHCGSACLCAILCVRVCVSHHVCVMFNDLFWWPGVADIEMDVPYALYGPCIFHIPAAKQSRAEIAYMARMLH